MNKKTTALWAAGALALSLGSQALMADDSIEFHGYIRSGFAVNQDLLNAAKDNSNGGVSSNLIGRLGNEDDSWVESELVKKITSDDGTWAKLHVGTAFSSTEVTQPLKTSEVKSTTAYVELGGFGFDPEAVFFVGKKGNSEDIHIMDFKWRKIDGAGIGVSGALGGLLDVNLLTSGNTTETATVPLNLDVRYKLLPNLQVEGAAAYAKDATKAASGGSADHGFQGAVVYYWDKFYGLPGWMTVAAQVGSGMYGAGTSNWNALGQLGNIWTKQDSMAYRLVTSGTGTFDVVDVAAGLWGEYDTHGSGTDPYTVVAGAVRPAWKLSKNFSLVGEVGGSEQWNKSISTSALASYKVTIAPTLALDSGVGARPQLRVFATYVGQDKALGLISADGTKDHEIKFGVQTEVWW
jgi:maltoporin